MSDNVFDISYSPALLPLVLLLGMGPKHSCVRVGQDSISVTMGYGFRATIPRQNVRAIMPDTASVGGWGVHGWRGTWLVNGSSAGIVRVELEPGVRAWVMGCAGPPDNAADQPEYTRRADEPVAQVPLAARCGSACRNLGKGAGSGRMRAATRRRDIARCSRMGHVVVGAVLSVGTKRPARSHS